MNMHKGRKEAMKNRWRLISLILVGVLILQGAIFGGYRLWNWQQEKALASQDKFAIEAFRTKYSLAEDTAVSGSRLTGQTLYIFNLEGKTVILLGNTWIEVGNGGHTP